MPKPIEISIKETNQELKRLKKSIPLHKQKRIQLLLLYKSGRTSTKNIIDALGINKNTVSEWKLAYMQGGTDLLLSDGRGINNQRQIKTSMRPIIEKRLSSPTEGFNSYIEAQQWINEHLGLEIGYQAARNYLRLYFGTKLKVGRKTYQQSPC
jgi:transposase